jgi:hypothetical protein
MNIFFIILLLIGGIALGWILRGIVNHIREQENYCDGDCENCEENTPPLTNSQFDNKIGEINDSVSELNDEVDKYINQENEDEGYIGYSIDCKIHSIRELLMLINMNIDEIADNRKKEKDGK